MEGTNSDSDFSDGGIPTEEESSYKSQLPEDYKSLTFEELLKVKDELGEKVYKEAVFGVKNRIGAKNSDNKPTFKRLSKGQPPEISAKRQVPFLGSELRSERRNKNVRDPRFDEKSGTYNADTFKHNYKFVSKIRQREVAVLKKELQNEHGEEERKKIKSTMQRLINKNVEQVKWQRKQVMLKKEQQEIQKAHNEGRQPHYATKKERRAKELVMQFEQLKKTGKLNKHLEKRRKKNTAKDRKKISLD